jgi:hypothetical protein
MRPSSKYYIDRLGAAGDLRYERLRRRPVRRLARVLITELMNLPARREPPVR